MDWGYISREFRKMELTEFEEALRTLAINLFDGGDLSNSNREMLEYIKNSKAYGHFDTSVENELQEGYGGNRLRYIFEQIFPPFRNVKYRYPMIWRHKYLYPFFVIRRIWLAATLNRKRVIGKLKHLFGRQSK